MVSLPTWVLIAILSLAGAKIATTPAGMAMKRGMRRTYRAFVPKRQPRPGDRLNIQCTMITTDQYACFVGGRMIEVTKSGGLNAR